MTFHTFRHTCASLLFEAGRDVKQVSEWLGHADAGFTLKVYVHLMDAGVGGEESTQLGHVKLLELVLWADLWNLRRISLLRFQAASGDKVGV